MTLIPSYGRDYTSKQQIKLDWLADKDFTIADLFHPDSGRQINRRDAIASNIDSVMVRYNRNTNIACIKVK